jgi:hypothetical protein
LLGGHLTVGPLVNLGERLLALDSILLEVLVQAASHDLGGGVRELNVALWFDKIFEFLKFSNKSEKWLTSNRLVSSTAFSFRFYLNLESNLIKSKKNNKNVVVIE